ncbi:MAG TPA: DUF4012 domain-containing protein [Chloroflexota bacterium]|nr:DUF4012 domain-containing protein [Chloroflexota bacterium]
MASIELVRLRLERARLEFADARDKLWPWSAVLVHLGWVPNVGPELQAVGPASDIAYRVTDAAVKAIDGLAPVLRLSTYPQGAGSRLPASVRVLAGSREQFAAAAVDMRSANGDLANLPTRVPNRRLNAMVTKLRTLVPKMMTASSWLALAPDLLGAQRPARYLFVWEDPAELRATGGFMGASDFITIDRGRISHRFYGNQLPYNRPVTTMPLPENVYTPESNWLFQDANWSPNFPLSARLQRWFYGADTGRWANGVVDFVDTATPDLLRATGRVWVPAFHTWVTARSVNAQAERYVNHSGIYSLTSAAGDVRRKKFFLDVLRALMKRVESVPVSRLPALVRAIGTMIQRRDLLLYDRRPAVESAIRSIGAAGRIVPGSGDYLYVVDDNRSYNKINTYVRERARLDVGVTSSLTLNETLIIRYFVAPSPKSIEGAGPDWGLAGTKHDYEDFLRVYVPLGSRLISESGLDAWQPRTAYGVNQFAGRVLVREGQTRTVVIRYRVPANVFGASADQRYSLRVQHQPGANLTRLGVTVRAMHGIRLRNRTAPLSTTLLLDRDARLDIGVSGSIRPAPVRLPSRPDQSDPYFVARQLRISRHSL